MKRFEEKVLYLLPIIIDEHVDDLQNDPDSSQQI